MANQLFTKSYFIRRLIKGGFFVKSLVDRYPINDSRYWTIIANPGLSSIFITCIRKEDKTSFKIVGPNHSQTKIETKSMIIILDVLNNINTHIDCDTNLTNEIPTNSIKKS
jgi:hypothetical protein